MLKKPSWFKRAKKEYVKAAKQKNIDYHKATPVQLENIRTQVLLNREKEKIALLKTWLLTVIVSVFVLWGTWEVFKFLLTKMGLT